MPTISRKHKLKVVPLRDLAGLNPKQMPPLYMKYEERPHPACTTAEAQKHTRCCVPNTPPGNKALESIRQDATQLPAEARPVIPGHSGSTVPPVCLSLIFFSDGISPKANFGGFIVSNGQRCRLTWMTT